MALVKGQFTVDPFMGLMIEPETVADAGPKVLVRFFRSFRGRGFQSRPDQSLRTWLRRRRLYRCLLRLRHGFRGDFGGTFRIAVTTGDEEEEKQRDGQRRKAGQGGVHKLRPTADQ